MLFQLLMDKKHFTHAEKMIANYILENTSSTLHMTASDLGKASYTSKATVLRLCKKLGDFTYQQFIHQLVKETNEKSRMLALLTSEPISAQTTLSELLDLVPSIYEKAISDTKSLINPTIIQRVINRIKKADCVNIYGGGIVESPIEAAVFKLQSLGISVNKQTNINEHALVANAKKNTVAILISFTGQNELILASARQFNQTSTYVVGIGGASNSELVGLCDDFIETYTEILIPSMEAIGPTLAVNYILDVIYSGLIISDYHQQVENAKQVIKISRFKS